MVADIHGLLDMVELPEGAFWMGRQNGNRMYTPTLQGSGSVGIRRPLEGTMRARPRMLESASSFLARESTTLGDSMPWQAMLGWRGEVGSWFINSIASPTLSMVGGVGRKWTGTCV